MKRLVLALQTVRLATLLALLAFASPGTAVASLMTFGFDAIANECWTFPNCPDQVSPTHPVPVKGLFTIDTDAPDLNPDSQNGRYEFSSPPTGLSITIGNLTLFTNNFAINVVNDQVGAFCESSMQRDFISITSPDLILTVVDTCDLAALTSDALIHEANLSLFHAYSTGPGFGLILGYGTEEVPFQITGGTQRIYRVPEPHVVTLVLLSLGLLGMAFARRGKR